MSTDDGKRLAQLHDAMQDRIRELEEALRDISEDYAFTMEGGDQRWGDRAKAYAATARYVLSKGIAR